MSLVLPIIEEVPPSCTTPPLRGWAQALGKRLSKTLLQDTISQSPYITWDMSSSWVFNISQIYAIALRCQNNRAAKIELLNCNQDGRSLYFEYWILNNFSFSTSARTLENGQSNVGLFRPMWKEALHGLLKEVRWTWKWTIGKEEVPEQTLVLSLPSQKDAAIP